MRVFKWIVYSLLGINVALFLTQATAVEALDSLAWLALLLLFEWESHRPHPGDQQDWQYLIIHNGRIAAYLVILSVALCYSAPSFCVEHGSLDMWNAWTWIAVVLILEHDTHRPSQIYSSLILSAKFLLYGALVLYAVCWGLTQGWLNFYDALLWILCFFVIELGVDRIVPDGS